MHISYLKMVVKNVKKITHEELDGGLVVILKNNRMKFCKFINKWMYDSDDDDDDDMSITMFWFLVIFTVFIVSVFVVVILRSLEYIK